MRCDCCARESHGRGTVVDEQTSKPCSARATWPWGTLTENFSSAWFASCVIRIMIIIGLHSPQNNSDNIGLHHRNNDNKRVASCALLAWPTEGRANAHERACSSADPNFSEATVGPFGAADVTKRRQVISWHAIGSQRERQGLGESTGHNRTADFVR